MPQPLPEELTTTSHLLLLRSPEALLRLPHTIAVTVATMPGFWAGLAGPEHSPALLEQAQQRLSDLAYKAVQQVLDTGHAGELTADVWVRLSQIHNSVDTDVLIRPFYSIPYELPRLYNWVLEHPGCGIVGPSTVATSEVHRESLPLPGQPGQDEVLRLSLSWQIACPIPQQDRELLRAIGAIQTIERIEKEEVVLCLPTED